MSRRLLAIVPARGGSERLPGKNIARFHGRPLVEHAVATALETGELDVVATSDSDDILAIAHGAGAHHLIRRPASLATGTASSADVAVHAVRHMLALGHSHEVVLLLQPTSPLRTRDHIREALDLFECRGSLPLVSVTTADVRPEGAGVGSPGAGGRFGAMVLGDDGCLEHGREPEPGNVSSLVGSAGRHVKLNGAIYLQRRDHLLASRSFVPRTGDTGYFMDPEHSVDIDTASDLARAESLHAPPRRRVA